jgi:hypothetical protein
MLRANLTRLRRVVEGLHSPRRDSTWADYAVTHQYEQGDERLKAEFVERVCTSRSAHLAWDVGANTGAFSRIAARSADYVLALEADAVSVDRLYASAKEEGSSRILPLVFDVADPSPALGWRNQERRILSERGRPDLVLCLAVLHHLVISAGIPLTEVISWLASLGTSIVIEFVDRADPMVQRLLRQKNEDYADYERSAFERGLAARFDVTDRRALESGTRVLYAAEPRREA